MIKSITFFVMQIRVIFALPSLVTPPLVPWAAAPVAYPSIHHCSAVILDTMSQHIDFGFRRSRGSRRRCAFPVRLHARSSLFYNFIISQLGLHACSEICVCCAVIKLLLCPCTFVCLPSSANKPPNRPGSGLT